MVGYELTNFLDSLEKSGIPGCDCAVYQNRRPVYRHMAGYADAGRTKPITEDTTYWLFSVTKLFTCTAVMQLVEKNRIGLDDPVYEYLPEYRNLYVKSGSEVKPAKNVMTIRHLMTMQSGLNYNIAAPSILKVVKETNGQASTRQIIKALAEEPLDFEPGTSYQYSLSHDVLGAVIEEVSGISFDKYLDENIIKPLGMKDTGFDLTPDRKARMADQFTYRPKTQTSVPITSDNIYVITENYKSGGAGLISTVNDLMLYLDAMCNDGMSAGGYQLLTPQSIKLMQTDQLSGEAKKKFDEFGKIGYSYGLGVRTMIDKEISGAKSPIGEFGWDGAAGAYALIDTKNKLAICYAQHVRGCDYAYNIVHPRIRDLTYEMLQIE
ncbi:MAG TPA: beta-lactamase family protein [Clostridiales bacterium]|nr:beta-lactamase family protein [Clostridiales bacterium]